MSKPRSFNQARRERVVGALTLLSFALSCWTLHRALRPRSTCVSSPYVYAVRVEGRRVDNCAFESRLRLDTPKISPSAIRRLRRLESAADLGAWFAREPRLFIEVDEANVRAFQLAPGRLRIGAAVVDGDRAELARAVAEGLLAANPAYVATLPFARATIADFITRTLGVSSPDVSFRTVAPSLATYCASPARSLAHAASCRSPAPSRDQSPSAWGFRPLVGTALARIFRELPLAQKMRVMTRVREGVATPATEAPTDVSARQLAAWTTNVVRAYAGALQMLVNTRAEGTLARALGTLDVGAPVHWDVTFDLRHTPAWREVAKQLLGRARFRRNERALIFTPDGEVTLPSGAAAHWAADQVTSAKHVVLACAFPPAGRGLKIEAPVLIARRSCAPLSQSFWD